MRGVAYIVGIMSDLLGTFEQIVLLAVLNLGDEAYGRAVLRNVEMALDRSTAAGAIYSTLDRVEQKGLLTSRLERGECPEGNAARGGRARRYYRLTARGVGALNDARAALEGMWKGRPWPLPLPSSHGRMMERAV